MAVNNSKYIQDQIRRVEEYFARCAAQGCMSASSIPEENLIGSFGDERDQAPASQEDADKPEHSD